MLLVPNSQSDSKTKPLNSFHSYEDKGDIKSATNQDVKSLQTVYVKQGLRGMALKCF